MSTEASSMPSPSSPESAVERHFIIFFPFLRLKKAYSVAGVEFVPLRDGDKNVPEVLESVTAPLERILSGYEGVASVWSKITSDCWLQLNFDRRMAKFKEEHPHFSWGADDSSASDS